MMFTLVKAEHPTSSSSRSSMTSRHSCNSCACTRLPTLVLAVQVTRSSQADGGSWATVVAVGVGIHHVVVDGRALWQFLRAWVVASRR
jgi:hypothetical protein